MYVYIYTYLGSSPSECQISHLFRCVLSYVLPLRNVGRSNFDKGLHNLTTLIKKRHILMRTAELYIHTYIYMCVCVCAYVTMQRMKVSANWIIYKQNENEMKMCDF